MKTAYRLTPRRVDHDAIGTFMHDIGLLCLALDHPAGHVLQVPGDDAGSWTLTLQRQATGEALPEILRPTFKPQDLVTLDSAEASRQLATNLQGLGWLLGRLVLDPRPRWWTMLRRDMHACEWKLVLHLASVPHATVRVEAYA